MMNLKNNRDYFTFQTDDLYGKNFLLEFTLEIVVMTITDTKEIYNFDKNLEFIILVKFIL